MKEAFLTQDRTQLQRVIEDFCELHLVWAWKLPAIERRISEIAEIVPNPQVVVIFKDPLSVAVRSAERRQKDPIKILQPVTVAYQRMAALAGMNVPLFLMSYEKAMANLPQVVQAAAAFAGVATYNERQVIAGIGSDATQYFVGRPENGGVENPALAAAKRRIRALRRGRAQA